MNTFTCALHAYDDETRQHGCPQCHAQWVKAEPSRPVGVQTLGEYVNRIKFLEFEVSRLKLACVKEFESVQALDNQLTKAWKLVSALNSDLVHERMQALQDLMVWADPAKVDCKDWSGWAVQYPGKLPTIYGDKSIAALNCYPDEGGVLLHLATTHRGAV